MTEKHYLHRYFKSIKNRRDKRQRAARAFCLFVCSFLAISGFYLKANPIVHEENSYVCEFKEPFGKAAGEVYRISFDAKKLEVCISHEKTMEDH